MAATNDFKYGEDGLLLLSTTGSTSGKAILRLTDISLSISNDVDETVTFDNAWSKVFNQTYTNWTISCSGVLSSDTGESEFLGTSSGDTKMVGTYNGLELIAVAKDRTTTKHVILKLDSDHYEKGTVIITSMEISASAGEKYVYSIEMQGSGQLTKVSS